MWVHALLKKPVVIKANKAKLVIDLKDIFVNVLKKQSLKQKKNLTELLSSLNLLEKSSKSTFTSSISRVIKGERLSAYGWSLVSDLKNSLD